MTIRQTLMPFLMTAELLDDGRLYAKVRRAVEVYGDDRYVRTAKTADLTIRPNRVTVSNVSTRRRGGIDRTGGTVTITKRATATVVEVLLEQLDIETDTAWRNALTEWMQLRKHRANGRRADVDGQWARLAALTWDDVHSDAENAA